MSDVLVELALPRTDAGAFVQALEENVVLANSLRIISNGYPIDIRPLDVERFEYSFPASRREDEGPLGTWYRAETLDARSRTTIGNPIFLRGE